MKLTREPVVVVQALIVPILMSLVLLFGWPENTVGVVQAAILAIGGAVAAAGVGRDALLPVLGGVAKAVIAVFLTFGLPLTPELETFILTVISVIVAYMTRPQVEAKVLPPVARTVVEGAWSTPDPR